MKNAFIQSQNHRPDFECFQCILRREQPPRPVLFEFIVDPSVLSPDHPLITSENNEDRIRVIFDAYIQNGYDTAVIPFWLTDLFSFPKGKRDTDHSVSQNQGGLITDEASFASYCWPDVDKGSWNRIPDYAAYLPKEMGMGVMAPGGVLENLVDLVGFEDMCFLLADEPEFLQEIIDKIGSSIYRYYERALAFPEVAFCVVNDDWGFKTQTMLSPGQMREHIFPWHKKIVELIHQAGRKAILHSCGFMGDIWDDIIDDMKYDAKHSYEDQIQPVEQIYRQYGDRIAIMGGMDIDFLSRSNPETIRQRCTAMLGLSAEKGGYALGSGNSIPRYIPRENFLAMRDSAF